VWIWVLIISSIVPSFGQAPDPPAPEELLRQAERCRSILKTSLVDFYLPACVDTVNGGYMESLRDGKFVLTGEKFLTLQARQLWFFSTLAIEGVEKEKALAAALSGFEFMESKMRDRKHGGYYSKVTDDGGRKDPRKHAYLNAFALYGLTAYYRATTNRVALEAAKELFRVLDLRAHDAVHGGYMEFFYDDWRPITDARESGYVGAIGHKTYNTHLHLLEAFAELCRAWPSDLVRQRLHELILINSSTVRHPEFNHNIDAWLPDWTLVQEPRNLRASYGHDIECVWLVLDAARTLNVKEGILKKWAESLCGASIAFGYDAQHGGFYNGGPLGKPADDLRKTWWVQAEALVAMLDLFRLTRDRRYYDRFLQTLDFVEKFQVAKEGSWWATRAADGSPTKDQQRSAPWHGAYHGGRAMIWCARLLDRMAGKNEATPLKLF
jgi:cellobiose epimerase